MTVSVTKTRSVQSSSPTLTNELGAKFAPVIVSRVAPAALPVVGATDETVGAEPVLTNAMGLPLNANSGTTAAADDTVLTVPPASAVTAY